MLARVCLASRRSAAFAASARVRSAALRSATTALAAGRSAVAPAAAVAALHGWARASSVLRTSQYGVSVTPGTGFGAAGDPNRKSKKTESSGNGGAGTDGGADAKADDWTPPNIDELFVRYQNLHTRRTRYLVVIFAALSVGMSIRLVRNRIRFDEALAQKDATIAKLKTTSDTAAVADRVLTLVDAARDAKHDYPTLRAALVREFEEARAAAAAAPTTTAAAPAPKA